MEKNFPNEEKRNAVQETENGRDALTGVWDRKSVEMQIMRKLHDGGTLFLCDINCLEKINQKFGHLEGDNVLKRVAQILGFLSSSEDILGRVGGDEFVIFAPGCRKEERAEELRERIENRFRSEWKKGERKAKIALTVVSTRRRRGDTWQSMFDRLKEELAGQTKSYCGGVNAEEKFTDGMQGRSRRICQSSLKSPGHTAGIIRLSGLSIAS